MMEKTAASARPQRPRGTPRRSFASLRSIVALMLREMSSTYGRSPGGYIWVILEPVAGIAFLTFVFAMLIRQPPIGISFTMFYATGVIPFSIFSDIQGKVSQSLGYSRALLAYPTVTFVDALVARLLLNAITKALIAYLVLGGAIVFFEGRMNMDLLTVAEGLALAAFLGFGIGVLNCYLFLLWPVWQPFWSVLMRPMFILSCIMMVYDGVPQPYRDWLWWNPVVHLVGLVRQGFYDTYDAYYASPLYVMLVSLICLALGLALLRGSYRDLLDR